MTTARYWHQCADGRLQCELCPRDCRLPDGQRGFCFVRRRIGDEIVLETYGRSTGFCLDPIEKKPLHHFYPGSAVLSFGTAGCNLGCKFCQNWEISKSREIDLCAKVATPDDIAKAAADYGARSVAFTYNDPIIFAEYAIDTAAACRAAGIFAVAVTAGYIRAHPRGDFFAVMDAANIDLKGFTEDFYWHTTGAHLADVLDTLRYVRHQTQTHLEITTLLIPGRNDSDTELGAMCTWIARELGRDVPQHFSAFHPDHRMRDVPPTPVSTLRRARQIALDTGLQYVYTGNVHDPAGESTYCPGCGQLLIERDRYRIVGYRLTSDGCCSACGVAVPGRFAPGPDDFGRRSIPVHLAR